MKQWLNNLLTAKEKSSFEEDGFFVIRNVLDPDHIREISIYADRVRSASNPRSESSAFMKKDLLVSEPDLFMPLVDHPKVFPKIFGLLGWNMSLYYTQLIVTPPKTTRMNLKDSNFHQDGYQVNKDLGSESLRPMLSLKAGFFISDCSKPDRGNLAVYPGLKTNTKPPADIEPVQLLMKPGDVVVFDRRLWHAGTCNTSNITRKVIYMGYAYRWLSSESLFDPQVTTDPIRKQLLRFRKKPEGAYIPESIPLQDWFRKNLKEP